MTFIFGLIFKAQAGRPKENDHQGVGMSCGAGGGGGRAVFF